MAYKLTMIFQMTTVPQGTAAVPRIAGWSESVYNSSLTAGTRAQFRDLMTARAALLPRSAAIVGQRYQVVDPTGGSSTGAERFQGYSFSGNPGDATDVPQVAIYCKTLTVSANIRPTTIRCIPDSWVVGGELLANTAITQALQRYFDQLTGWSMRGRNLSAPQYPIFQISETGLVSLTAVQAIAVPGLVRISSSVDEDGIRRGGAFKALTQPTPSSVQLEGWTYGATKGGNIRVQTPGLIQMTTTSVSRIITRKVGRPLFAFRGRRSRRRR